MANNKSMARYYELSVADAISRIAKAIEGNYLKVSYSKSKVFVTGQTWQHREAIGVVSKTYYSKLYNQEKSRYEIDRAVWDSIKFPKAVSKKTPKESAPKVSKVTRKATAKSTVKYRDEYDLYMSDAEFAKANREREEYNQAIFTSMMKDAKSGKLSKARYIRHMGMLTWENAKGEQQMLQVIHRWNPIQIYGFIRTVNSDAKPKASKANRKTTYRKAAK